jgi:ABC-type phosphate transport system auxiliary subunit
MELISNYKNSLQAIYDHVGFLEFEKNQSKTERGGMILYDIKGHYKYLTFSELLDYYIKNIIR